METVRAEALFVSDIGFSDALTVDVVRDAVMGSVRRYGPRGCSAMVATAFAEQPDLAAPRMSWVMSAIRTVYPVSRSPRPWSPSPSPLAA
jgi:hypothetical protein